jgi:hypothetical protein
LASWLGGRLGDWACHERGLAHRTRSDPGSMGGAIRLFRISTFLRSSPAGNTGHECHGSEGGHSHWRPASSGPPGR